MKTNGGGGGVLIGFFYIEIRFLNKNIVKYLKINAIFFARVFIFSSCFLFCSITDNTKLQFYGLSSIKCTSENTKYTQIFRAVWRYLY